MATAYEILLKIGGKLDNSLPKSAQQAVKNVEGIKNSVGMLKHVGEAVIGFEAVKKVVEFGKESIEAYNTAATAAARLQTTMSNVKGTTQEQINAVSEYTEALEKNTSISHVVNSAGASQLATFGLNADAIEALLPALDSMAVAQNGVTVSSEQMQTTANIIGKMMAGNTSAASRYGIILTETQKKIFKNGTEAQKAAALVNIMKNKYGDLATQMAQTPTGRIQQFKNAWEGVKETIGEKLTPVATAALNMFSQKLPAIEDKAKKVIDFISPALKYITSTIIPGASDVFNNNLMPAFDAIGKWVQNHMPEIKTVFKDTFNVAKTVVGDVADVIKFLADHSQTVTPVILGMAAAIGACAIAQTGLNIIMAANPIGLVVAAVAALVLGIEELSKHFQQIKEWADKAAAAVKKFLGLKDNPTSNAVSSAQEAIENANTANGTVPSYNIPAYASGTRFSRGGLALVGEKGPELVNLPKGSAVANANRTSQMIRGAAQSEGGSLSEFSNSSSTAINHGDVNITYAPKIIIQGNASKEDVKSALDDSQSDFDRKMAVWQRNQRRLAFG